MEFVKINKKSYSLVPNRWDRPLNFNFCKMKKLLVVIVILSAQWSKAQDLESILLASEDASLLFQNYFDPAMKGMMFGMNNGWASTAKVYKTLGFDVTIGANASFIPSAGQTFLFNADDYRFLSLPGGQTKLPTLMSDSDAEVQVAVSVPLEDGTYRVGSFMMPKGIGNDLPINAVPSPVVQIGLGLPLKTTIKARFVPNINFHDDLDAGLFGLGLQHDVMQYLGPIQNLPLNVSILGAFTVMKMGYAIDNSGFNDNMAVSNGRFDFKMNVWTVQLLASLDFKLITVYGGFGYNNGETSVKIKGDYRLNYDLEDDQGNYMGSVTETLSDPLNLAFNANGARVTLGGRLNLGIFKIFADYTIQEYNTATVGIAFSVR